MSEPTSTQPSAPDAPVGHDATGLRQDLLELGAKYRATRAQLDISRRQLMEAEQIIAEVRTQREAAEAALHVATTSRTWRLLAPARSLAGAARALRGRLGERI